MENRKASNNFYRDSETNDIDSLSAYEMLIRWEIAAEYFAEVEADGRLADSALRTLVNRDIPLLLNELQRLRPGVLVPLGKTMAAGG